MVAHALAGDGSSRCASLGIVSVQSCKFRSLISDQVIDADARREAFLPLINRVISVSSKRSRSSSSQKFGVSVSTGNAVHFCTGVGMRFVVFTVQHQTPLLPLEQGGSSPSHVL